MLPSICFFMCDSKMCLNCVPKSMSVMFRKFQFVNMSYLHIHSEVQKKPEYSMLKGNLTLLHNHFKPYHSVESTTQLHHLLRNYQKKSKSDSSSYFNRKILRMSRSVPGYPHQRYSNTGIQCRAYSTRSVSDTLKEWTEKLESASVPEARLSAEYIIAHILDVPRKELKFLGESLLIEEFISEAERLMTCRLARMPLQYIIGNWDFHSITLKLRPPVFIPRPETEQLVELALECLQGIQKPKVLDIGCGSGAISLALLKNISNLRCVALDQSKHAIQLTEENAVQLGVQQRLMLVHQKLTQEEMPTLPYDNFDLVVSNPPYVLRKDLMDVQPEIMIYEDMRALDGGKDGLDVIKPILSHSQHVLCAGKHLLLEVDPCHQYLVPAWLHKQQEMKIQLLEIVKDFEGKDRFLKFVRTG